MEIVKGKGYGPGGPGRYSIGNNGPHNDKYTNNNSNSSSNNSNNSNSINNTSNSINNNNTSNSNSNNSKHDRINHKKKVGHMQLKLSHYNNNNNNNNNNNGHSKKNQNPNKNNHNSTFTTNHKSSHSHSHKTSSNTPPLPSQSQTPLLPQQQQQQQQQQTNTTLRTPIDIALLARGMTARTIGSRISNQIKPLTNSDVEKDLRHMEAYHTACILYAQHYFAFHNRPFVDAGVYGPVPQSMTGVKNNGTGTVTGAITSPPSQDVTNMNTNAMNATATSAVTTTNSSVGNPTGAGGITMPIRIDPEEEKRIALLRSRVAVSESKREILETEYLSLRAHYVHESHKLRRAKDGFHGQLQLLKDIVKKRGDVLAMHRVKFAVANEILNCLNYRSDLMKLGSVSSSGDNVGNGNRMGNNSSNAPSNGSDNGPTAIPMDVDETNPSSTNDTNNNNTTSTDGLIFQIESGNTTKTNTIQPSSSVASASVKDLTEVWDMIEDQIQEAELACTTSVETPKALLQLKAALEADAIALEVATEKAAMGGGNSISSGSQKRSRSPRDNDNDGDSGDATSYRDNGKRSKKDDESNVIPWNCPVMPRTPYDVAILLSNLSTAPDCTAAFACSNGEGKPSDTLIWLEDNLPNNQNGDMEKEEEKLRQVREDVRLLKEELSQEVKANSGLQKEIIQGRKRRDQLCAMMGMIRNETEAVLERHNDLLQTPEVVAEIGRIYDEESLETDEEGELDDGGNSDEGTVVADEDDDQDDNVDGEIAFGSTKPMLGDVSDSHPMSEITVSIAGEQENINENSPQNTNNKRGYEVATEDSTVDTDKKRRKI